MGCKSRSQHLSSHLLTSCSSVALPWLIVTQDDDTDPEYKTYVMKITETFRIVAAALDDLSWSDIERFLLMYCGPPEGLELLFLQGCTGIAPCFQDINRIWSKVLANALRVFCCGHPRWTCLVRDLVRRGVDVHGSGSNDRRYYRKDETSPLDSLFLATRAPLEAKEVGDAWLHLLSDEGYEVKVYLEEEMALHGPQPRLVKTEFWDDGLKQKAWTTQIVYDLGGHSECLVGLDH